MATPTEKLLRNVSDKVGAWDTVNGSGTIVPVSLATGSVGSVVFPPPQADSKMTALALTSKLRPLTDTCLNITLVLQTTGGSPDPNCE